MAETRRGFLRGLGASTLGLAAGSRARAAIPADGSRQGRSAARTRGRYGIVYNSFAIRLRRGRDIREAGPPGLLAEPFVDLCRSFGADGCQLDLTQLAATDAAYLDGLRRRIEEARLFVELSASGKALEDDERFADVARIARRLGAERLRIPLNGRRYDEFKTRKAWLEFADHWRAVLLRAKGVLERHKLEVGIENHREWTAEELVELFRAVGSPYLGACFDFGNNLTLLEHPLDTAKALAPYVVTTHLKDMALCPYERGFELTEVPLGTGLCPLAEMIGVLRAARPEVPLCLEMITRDPQKVPYRDDAYWASFGGKDAARVAAFEKAILSRASAEPLPRVSGLSLEKMLEREDENVRRSTAFARETLHL